MDNNVVQSEEQEGRVRLLQAQADALPQILWTSECNGSIIFANKRFLEYTGLSREDICSPRVTSTIHPDDRAEYDRTRAVAIATGTNWEHEYRLKRHDGVYRWHLGRCVPGKSGQGVVTHWFGSATDIQEQKQTQEHLRELIEQRELAFEAARIGVWDWDLTRNRGRWSPEQRRLFGLPDNFLDDFARFTEFVHPEDRERVLLFMKGVLADAGRILYDEEFRIVQPDGAIRWLHGRGRVERDDNTGQALRVIGINMDVTERKQAEIALSDTRNRLSFHVANSPLAVIEWDSNWRISQWNKRAEQIFGYTAEEMLGASGADWTHVHAEDSFRVEQMRRRMMETGFGVVQSRNITKHGRIIHCEWYNTILKSESGQMHSVLSQVLDVSERVHAEATLAESHSKQTRIAETLQQSLLLTPPEDAFSGIELGTLYEPTQKEAQVGGDFYDAFSFRPNRVCLVVGDVTGKGLGAARYTAEVKFALRAYMHETEDVTKSLTLLNRFLCDQRRRGNEVDTRFVAVAVMILDTHTGEGSCALSGMETPLIYRAARGATEELPAQGVVLGAMREAEYESQPFTIQPGDWVVMTTDGTTEARSESRRLWGTEGMARSIDAALRRAPEQSPRNLAQTCLKEAKLWSRGRLTDDVCILAARFVGTKE